MKEGWIKLHRQIQDHDFWYSERFTRGQAWVDILMLANHGRKTLFIRGNEITIERGQTAYSIVSLSRMWQWNARTVASFLDSLVKRQMITQQKTSVTTIITVVNYTNYQSSAEQSTQQSAEQSTSRVQTNKKDKNVKNVRNNVVFPKSFLRWLRQHGKSEKYAQWIVSTVAPIEVIEKAWQKVLAGKQVGNPAGFVDLCKTLNP